MKIVPAIFILILGFSLFGCWTRSGDLIDPPEGLKQAVKTKLAEQGYTLKGLSVRATESDSLQVSADADYTGTNEYAKKHVTKMMLVSPGSSNGQSYWQITVEAAAPDPDILVVAGFERN